jgi:hypothetical protein
MQPEDLILVTDFCASHSISRTLILEFKEYGLVNILEEQNTLYIPVDELPKAEKILRIHSELDINLEGVEVITRLLEKLDAMHQEVNRLQNRLRLYE